MQIRYYGASPSKIQGGETETSYNFGNRKVLAYSVLAIAVLAAVSSVGIAFAASNSPTTTTSTSTGSQSSSGTQAGSTGSTNPCPHMGGSASPQTNSG